MLIVKLFSILCFINAATGEELAPYYYFAPRHEGFGALFKQLGFIAREIVSKQKRQLIIVPHVNNYHYKDLQEKRISFCDVLILPSEISCSARDPEEIIQHKACKVECTAKWMCDPCQFVDMPNIKKIMRRRGSGTEAEINGLGKYCGQNITFQQIGVDNQTHDFERDR